MMAYVAMGGAERGIARLEWSTAADNSAAQALYAELGAEGSEKIHFVLEGIGFQQLRDEALKIEAVEAPVVVGH